MTALWAASAAHIAVDHSLTFFDAAWSATAEGLGVPLVSADHALIQTGRAESATEGAARFGLL